MIAKSTLKILVSGICLPLSLSSWGVGSLCKSAFAAEVTGTQQVAEPQQQPSGAYHTPLAGEPLHTVFMGKNVDVPAMDRGKFTTLTLGGAYYTPKQGSITAAPLGNIYLKRTWESSRTRDLISIFVNDLEYDKSFGNLELVTRFTNNTVPLGQKETLNNKEINESKVAWGNFIAAAGPGLRYKVAPYQVDNDLRLQLLGEVGYAYAKRTDDTAPTTVLPPDTMLYGVKLRGRYDGMRRNLLELPHAGYAAGFDVDYLHRDKWADFGSNEVIFRKSDTQDYIQYAGYLMGVGGIPGMSEKNRLLGSLHGGAMEGKSADRFNAFRIGGGPLPGESDDLCRPEYPGAMFNNVPASQYAIMALEYRRELAFFLYAHLRETLIWAKRATLDGSDQVGFKSDNGGATTIGLDSGFFWDSEIYLDYSWDSGFIRDGRKGSGLILIWNKNF